MKILLNNVGKKYNKQWIFKQLSYTFITGESYALLGNNGSGKSTLLQCIIGAIQFSEGNIEYQDYTNENAFQQFSFAAPYIELIEEMTLVEQLEFHQKFKPFYNNYTTTQIAAIIGLDDAMHKQLGNYSSGMKQRAKLALAFFSQSSVLCLDEPLSNLDNNGILLFEKLMKDYIFNRTLIISSNDVNEYRYCTHQLLLGDYK